MLKKNKLTSLAIMIFVTSLLLASGCGFRDTTTQTTDTNAKQEDNIIVPKETDAGESGVDGDYAPELSTVPDCFNTNTQEIYYREEDGIDLERAAHRCATDGENIYLAYYEPDLYVMSIGSDVHKPVNIENPDGLYVCNVATDKDGGVHLLMSDHNLEKWYIWKLNQNYEKEKELDISAYFDTKRIPIWFLIDHEGTYYLQWPINRNGIIVDREGNLRDRTSPASLGIDWIYEAAVGKDGKTYLVYSMDGEKIEIGEIDLSKVTIKKCETDFSFSNDETFGFMSAGADTNLLLFSPFSGVWAYDQEQGIMENRVPLVDTGFDADNEIYPLAFVSDGRLLLIGTPANSGEAEGEIDQILRYIPVVR